MAIYVRGTYRQTQLFYWLIIGRFTTTCFGPILGPSCNIAYSRFVIQPDDGPRIGPKHIVVNLPIISQ